MKKCLKGILGILLALTLVTGTCAIAFADGTPAPAAEPCTCGDDPTVFVNGIGETFYTDSTMEQPVIPADAGTYIKAILPRLGSFLFGAIFKKYDKCGDALIAIANDLIGGTGCDKDGNVPEGQCVDWEYSTSFENHGRERDYNFSYDYRLSPIDIAADLEDYIDYICAQTGHTKVKLVGFSMGSAVTLAYLSTYGTEKVSGVCLLAGCHIGTTCCGEPFCLKMLYEPYSAIRYFNDLMYGQSNAVTVSSLFGILYKIGLLDRVGNTLMAIIDSQGSRVYDECIRGTFAATPGMFALIPADLYDEAVNNIFGSCRDEYAGLISKLDAYHEMQVNAENIYKDIVAKGINFGVVSKYGFQLFPFMDHGANNSDGVIDAKFTSLGATVADTGTTLTDTQKALTDKEGKSCVSPDNIVNAATCLFPQYTWFVRNLPHSTNPSSLDDITRYILYSETQPTVNDNADYPQFMLYEPDSGDIVPLTADNIPEEYDASAYSFFDFFTMFFKSLFA